MSAEDYIKDLERQIMNLRQQAVKDAAEIERLQAEIRGHLRAAASVSEALNMGDGAYRP